MCGSTSGQKDAASAAASSAQTAASQAASIYGNSNQVFSDLKNTFMPTIAAGASQNGFSGQTLSNLNSSAITQVGTEAKNEKAAVGNAEAAAGGGVSQLPSGGQIGSDLSLAENAGNQTSSELAQIQQANEQQGNANYNNAVGGLEKATDVFNPSISATGATTNANNANSTAQNSVSASNMSPWTAAIGAAGALGGAALGNLGSFGSNTQGTGAAGLQTAQQISQIGSSGLSTTNPTVTAGVE